MKKGKCSHLLHSIVFIEIKVITFTQVQQARSVGMHHDLQQQANKQWKQSKFLWTAEQTECDVATPQNATQWTEHRITLNTTESKNPVRLKQPSTKEHIEYDSTYKKFKHMEKTKKYTLVYIIYDKLNEKQENG